MNQRQILNRDTIKYIAMLTMLLNHIANVFLEPGTILSTIFLDLGYFTAPVMCYFLVEGYHYTRSKRKYAQRLALFALLSEIPFCLAFSQVYTGARILSFCGFNMIFTLLLCFGILYVREQMPDGFRKSLSMVLLFFLSLFSDWAVLAPLFTLLFARAGKDKRKIKNVLSLSQLYLRFSIFSIAAGFYWTWFKLCCQLVELCLQVLLLYTYIMENEWREERHFQNGFSICFIQCTC